MVEGVWLMSLWGAAENTDLKVQFLLYQGGLVHETRYQCVLSGLQPHMIRYSDGLVTFSFPVTVKLWQSHLNRGAWIRLTSGWSVDTTW